jgi:hypothetical protein
MCGYIEALRVSIYVLEKDQGKIGLQWQEWNMNLASSLLQQGLLDPSTRLMCLMQWIEHCIMKKHCSTLTINWALKSNQHGSSLILFLFLYDLQGFYM